MMKKVLLLALVIASYGLASAQQPTELPKDFKLLPAAPSTKLPTSSTPAFNKGGSVDGWFSPLDFITNNFSGSVDQGIAVTFPDSTVQFVSSDNTTSWQGFHAFGHMFDLRHELWSAVPSDPSAPILQFNQKDSYSWDSIAYRYVYIRHYPDANVVDTAFVHYYKNAIPDGIATGILLFDTDTVRFQRPDGYNVSTLSGSAYFDVDTILLTVADTTSFGSGGWTQKFRTVPVGTTIPRTTTAGISRNPNSLFGFTVSFRPGHPYNFGDTIESQGTVKQTNGVNYFGGFVLSIPSPGAGQSALPVPLRTNDYMETSVMLNKSTRYGQTNSGNWDGFIPGLAFFSTQYMDCQARVSGLSTVGVKEVKDLGYSLGTVYPNPVANGLSLNIEYTLRDAGDVTIEIFDLMGKKMATVVNNERTDAGLHTATVNTNLAPGVYLYTLKSGDVIINSKKFTVTR